MKNSLKTTDGVEIKKGNKYWFIDDINLVIKRTKCTYISHIYIQLNPGYNPGEMWDKKELRGYLYNDLKNAKQRFVRLLKSRKNSFQKHIKEIENKIKEIK